MKLDVATNPGPGEYNAGDEYSLFKTLTRRTVSRNTTFGISAARFPDAGPGRRADGDLPAAELPGPHSYDPAPVPPRTHGSQPSSNFASRTKRMVGARPPAEPKPGEFEHEDGVLGELFDRAGGWPAGSACSGRLPPPLRALGCSMRWWGGTSWGS
jgi:hypothetical protein